MDKLTIATQVLLKLIETDKTGFDAEGISGYAWEIADAMQAEAEKRINKERPKVFFEPKCEVDWTQAPSNAIGWMFFDGVSTWLGEDGFLIEDAPLFGFKDACIMERPHGL